jgi:hypothetical protein
MRGNAGAPLYIAGILLANAKAWRVGSETDFGPLATAR